MNLNLLLLFGLIFAVGLSVARPAEEEGSKHSLIGRRSPLAGRNNKATTSTTTPAPKEEAAEEGDYAEEGEYVDEAAPETSSTTEAPKKFIKTGVVRPFRSNEDFLARLQKRREQATSNKKHSAPVHAEPEEAEAEPANEPAPKAAKPAAGRRNRFQKEKASEPAPAAEEAAAPAPARTGRRFNARS